MRRMKRRVKREERHKDVCICGDHEIDCGHCAVALIISGIVLFLTIIGTVLTFTSVIHTCTSSTQCEAGPGERAFCRGICMIEPLPNYCQSDLDCAPTECHTSKCGADGTCFYVAQHGIPCDDGSACTLSDQCHHGICRGVEMTKPCSTCEDGVFVPDSQKDGMACSDNSKCTMHDACHAGECVGEDVSCPNATCKVGVCDPQTGCSLVNVPDSALQPDLCTTARCENGNYIETFKECFDGNPCTVDSCFPLSGECVHPPSDESCLTVCSNDSDCHAVGSDANYACWDGMCADVSSTEMIIRVTHADLDTASCPDNHTRLQLRFFMDSPVENGLMHIPMTESIVPVYPHMDAFDVETVYKYDNHAVRTHFSMRTVCKDYSIDCYPFINGEYEFVVRRYPCTNVAATHCQMNHPSSTYVTAPVSVIECPRAETILLSLVPTLTIDHSYYTVNASLELGDVDAWITDVEFCIPKEGPMKECILNGDTQCPYRGCFDTPDVYLDYRITFLKDSNYTAAVTTSSNLFNMRFARGYESYNGDRCESVDAVDWISFTMLSIAMNHDGRDAVLDIKYDVPLCNNRRRLSEKMRRLGTFQL